MYTQINKNTNYFFLFSLCNTENVKKLKVILKQISVCCMNQHLPRTGTWCVVRSAHNKGYDEWRRKQGPRRAQLPVHIVASCLSTKHKYNFMTSLFNSRQKSRYSKGLKRMYCVIHYLYEFYCINYINYICIINNYCN